MHHFVGFFGVPRVFDPSFLFPASAVSGNQSGFMKQLDFVLICFDGELLANRPGWRRIIVTIERDRIIRVDLESVGFHVGLGSVKGQRSQ